MQGKGYLLFVLICFVFVFNGFSQKKKLWSAIEKSSINEQLLVKKSTVINYKTFDLELSTLKADLKAVSKKGFGRKEGIVVEFPNAKGELLKFSVRESSVLHPILAAKYPVLKTYIGQSLEGNLTTIHFSVTPLGLYAMLISPKNGTTFIDPYTKDRNTYMIYSKKDVRTVQPFECLMQSSSIKKITQTAVGNANDLKLRTFRLAIATTEEYSSFHITAEGLGAGNSRSELITAVLAAVTTTITRVNAIFERDVALSMQLVANTDQLLFLETDPGDDPYTNEDKQAMLAQNQITIDNVIGAGNYDIGHVFSTGSGGVAFLGSSCGISKAGGVTGSDTPVGDAFNIDYVAHEMGHQFGANHTFNSTANNCGNGNRNADTAVEPGSGSTIMGYAGICAPENVQSHSDAYFHSISIHEIIANITTGNSQCAVKTDFTVNLNVPVANAGNDYTIPKSTPFKLKGEGFDADGNQLTFSWEQIDNEVGSIQNPPSSTQVEGAVFRSFIPMVESDRYFPSLPAVIAGGNVTWEVLPSVSRSLHFDLTIRDNVVGEGQTDTDDMEILVNATAGPFLVTSQDFQNISWTPSATETITWDVAGTDGNDINVSEVNILLSLDGGITFPVVLASNTPNDGEEQIIVPSETGSNVRVMVEAVDHIFYAVNSEPFAIGSFTTTCTSYDPADTPIAIPDDDSAGVISTVNILDDYAITDVNVAIDISHPWIRDLQIYLKAPNGDEVLLYDRSCGDSNTGRININAIFDDQASATICQNSNPAISGTTMPDNLLASLNTLSSFGDWELRVIDNANQDMGTLNQWSLELCKADLTVDVAQFSVQDTKVFPNPFTDLVNLMFNTASLDTVTLTLYDIRGGVVFVDSITNPNHTFSKTLDFTNFASGVYILNIQQGSQSTSKKIIKY